MSLGDFIAKNPFLASYSHKNRCFGLRENQELDSSFSRVKRYGHQLQSVVHDHGHFYRLTGTKAPYKYTRLGDHSKPTASVRLVLCASSSVEYGKLKILVCARLRTSG